MKRPLIFVLIYLLSTSIAQGATEHIVIDGYVLDDKSGEPLPAANLQIEGTLSGAITNRDGRFSLELKTLPASILVSYIGYESRRVQIKHETSQRVNIRLHPIILEMEAIEVTAEDPAMNIMRKVIKKKQEWRKLLKTYQADAYTRVLLENDSGIVSIAESISRAFWDAEKGSREVILTRRQTNNLEQADNFAAASYIPNFYDDEINIMGFRIIGVTHPDALDYYRFKLTGRRMRDDKIVYDIEVISNSLLQPTFVGNIAVLDEDYAVIDVDLKPGENVLLPPPFKEYNLYYKQQFSNFGREFWLPVDVRIDGDILIGFPGLQFPRIKYSQLSHLNDYETNVALPDSLYEEKKQIVVDSSTVDSVQLFVDNPDVVPLTSREDTAYHALDSTMTMERAFRPTGFLAKLAGVDEDDDNSDTTRSAFSRFVDHFGAELWFNRVDALHTGLRYEKTFAKRFDINLTGAYNTGSKKWAYGAGFTLGLLKRHRLKLRIEHTVGTASQFDSKIYPWLMTSVLPLFALDDYFDYYWREHTRGEIKYDWRAARLQITAGVNHERHRNLSKTTEWNIPGKTYSQRENPQIQQGILRSLDLTLAFGREQVPFGMVGNENIEISIEHSSPALLNSDFDFTRYQGVLEWRLTTFLRRRMLPNALDIKLIGGYSTGKLPLQRYGAVDGNLFAFTPFGGFRTLNGRVYRGQSYAAILWEHNFRTAPLELLGLRSLAKKGIGLILHGAHGRTWIDDADLADQPSENFYSGRWHHELGFSVNSLFSFLRIDFTRRLDQPAFYLGFSMARMF